MMQPLPSMPVTGPVTETERTYAVELLRSTQTALHQAIAGLSDEQLGYKPVADRWSVAECAEHIVLVETGIFGRIRSGMDAPAEPERRAEIRIGDVDVIKAIRTRSVQVPAPAPFVPTGHFGNIVATMAAFDEQREAAITYAQTVTADLRTHYFVHFRLGTLDAYQALLLLASHGERHRKQIEEVKADAGFPA
jgi:DinB superfamily